MAQVDMHCEPMQRWLVFSAPFTNVRKLLFAVQSLLKYRNKSGRFLPSRIYWRPWPLVHTRKCAPALRLRRISWRCVDKSTAKKNHVKGLERTPALHRSVRVPWDVVSAARTCSRTARHVAVRNIAFINIECIAWSNCVSPITVRTTIPVPIFLIALWTY